MSKRDKEFMLLYNELGNELLKVHSLLYKMLSEKSDNDTAMLHILLSKLGCELLHNQKACDMAFKQLYNYNARQKDMSVIKLNKMEEQHDA